MPRIAIVVGEASGDQLGRGLIEALRARFPDAEFVGVTGPQMRAAGCESWADCSQLAIMGLVEVLRHLPGLQRLMKDLRGRLRDQAPDVLIGIDAPDFNLRLEAHAKRLGIPTVHYVCPSVWAWRQSRVKILRRSCDRVLCLLPFEAGFLSEHEVAADFVGHPLADEIGAGLNVESCRNELGLSDAAGGQVLAVLPGSRAAEVQQLMPVFLETVRQLQDSKPKLRILVAAANDRLAGQIRLLADQAGLADTLDVRVGATRTVLGAADTVLLASGTATLETMLVRRPMVVAYRMNALTAWLARRLIKAEFVSLPNLLAGEALVPEFLQQEATPGALATAVLEQLNSPEHCAAMVARFAELSEQLRCSASDRAADAVADVLRA